MNCITENTNASPRANEPKESKTHSKAERPQPPTSLAPDKSVLPIHIPIVSPDRYQKKTYHLLYTIPEVLIK